MVIGPTVAASVAPMMKALTNKLKTRFHARFPFL